MGIYPIIYAKSNITNLAQGKSKSNGCPKKIDGKPLTEEECKLWQNIGKKWEKGKKADKQLEADVKHIQREVAKKKAYGQGVGGIISFHDKKENKPQNAKEWIIYGEALLGVGRFTNAKTAFTNAGSPEGLGNFYNWTVKEKINPKGGFKKLSLIQWGEGKWDWGAEYWYRKALEKNPSLPKSNLGLGQVLARQSFIITPPTLYSKKGLSEEEFKQWVSDGIIQNLSNLSQRDLVTWLQNAALDALRKVSKTKENPVPYYEAALWIGMIKAIQGFAKNNYLDFAKLKKEADQKLTEALNCPEQKYVSNKKEGIRARAFLWLGALKIMEAYRQRRMGKKKLAIEPILEKAQKNLTLAEQELAKITGITLSEKGKKIEKWKEELKKAGIGETEEEVEKWKKELEKAGRGETEEELRKELEKAETPPKKAMNQAKLWLIWQDEGRDDQEVATTYNEATKNLKASASDTTAQDDKATLDLLRGKLLAVKGIITRDRTLLEEAKNLFTGTIKSFLHEDFTDSKLNQVLKISDESKRYLAAQAVVWLGKIKAGTYVTEISEELNNLNYAKSLLGPVVESYTLGDAQNEGIEALAEVTARLGFITHDLSKIKDAQDLIAKLLNHGMGAKDEESLLETVKKLVQETDEENLLKSILTVALWLGKLYAAEGGEKGTLAEEERLLLLAEKFIQEAVEKPKKLRGRKFADALRTLGEIQLRLAYLLKDRGDLSYQDKIEAAEKNLEASLRLAEKLKAPDLIASATLWLAKVKMAQASEEKTPNKKTREEKQLALLEAAEKYISGVDFNELKGESLADARKVLGEIKAQIGILKKDLQREYQEYLKAAVSPLNDAVNTLEQTKTILPLAKLSNIPVEANLLLGNIAIIKKMYADTDQTKGAISYFNTASDLITERLSDSAIQNNEKKKTGFLRLASKAYFGQGEVLGFSWSGRNYEGALGAYAKAIESLDQISSLNINDRKLKINLLLGQARVYGYSRLRDEKAALAKIESARVELTQLLEDEKLGKIFKDDPEKEDLEARILLAQANLYLGTPESDPARKGNFEKAAALYEAVLAKADLDPNLLADAKLGKANLLASVQDINPKRISILEEADRVYDEVIKTAIISPELILRAKLGKANLLLSKIPGLVTETRKESAENIRKLYQEVIDAKLDPLLTAWAIFGKANLRAKENKIKEALELYQRITNPQNAEDARLNVSEDLNARAKLAEANLLLKNKHKKEAAELFSKVLDELSTWQTFDYTLIAKAASGLASAKNYTDAITIFQALLGEEIIENLKPSVNIKNIADKIKEKKPNLSHLAKAEIKLELAKILSWQEKTRGKAMALIEKVLEKFPLTDGRKLENLIALQANLYKAQIQSWKDEPEDALKLARKMLEKIDQTPELPKDHPLRLLAYEVLAGIYHMQEEDDQFNKYKNLIVNQTGEVPESLKQLKPAGPKIVFGKNSTEDVIGRKENQLIASFDHPVGKGLRVGIEAADGGTTLLKANYKLTVGKGKFNATVRQKVKGEESKNLIFYRVPTTSVDLSYEYRKIFSLLWGQANLGELSSQYYGINLKPFGSAPFTLGLWHTQYPYYDQKNNLVPNTQNIFKIAVEDYLSKNIYGSVTTDIPLQSGEKQDNPVTFRASIRIEKINLGFTKDAAITVGYSTSKNRGYSQSGFSFGFSMPLKKLF